MSNFWRGNICFLLVDFYLEAVKPLPTGEDISAWIVVWNLFFPLSIAITAFVGFAYFMICWIKE